MKFLVISDTHGKLEKVYEIFEKHEGIDAVLHLGDYEKDAEELRNALNTDVIAVKGNMDGGFGENEYKIVETECGKLYLAHGHIENVKMKYQNIYYRALEHGCMAALFGHTHKAVFENMGDIYLVNPGSLTFPADGSRGTYAVIETSKEGLTGKICEYEHEHEKDENAGGMRNRNSGAAGNKTAKVQGGYLRGLLNYSDRF